MEDQGEDQGKEIRDTDITHIEKLLAETKEQARIIRDKAYLLNNRAQTPKEAEKKPEVPQQDIGTELKIRIKHINVMLADTINSLEAFV